LFTSITTLGDNTPKISRVFSDTHVECTREPDLVTAKVTKTETKKKEKKKRKEAKGRE